MLPSTDSALKKQHLPQKHCLSSLSLACEAVNNFIMKYIFLDKRVCQTQKVEQLFTQNFHFSDYKIINLAYTVNANHNCVF